MHSSERDGQEFCSPLQKMYATDISHSVSLDSTPIVFELDTPDMSLDMTMSKNINPGFPFINCLEFGAYQFVYVLSVRIMMIVITVIHADQHNIEIRNSSTEEHSIPLPFDPLLEVTVHQDIDQNNPETDQSLAKAKELLSPDIFLQNLRLKNNERILIGHLNINSIRNKIGLLEDLVHNRIDILLVCETKIDGSFPTDQFRMMGFSTPFRLDRTKRGGGLLLYIRKDIPAQRKSLIVSGIECIMVEVTISKKKWLLCGIYNPEKKLAVSFLNTLSKNLDHFSASYDNIIILGDFNTEVSDVPLEEFCLLYDLKSLIKSPTCFKSDTNPSCIDLIMTNRNTSFQNSFQRLKRGSQTSTI